MERFTLILVGDERSPVRRMQIPKPSAQKAVALAAVVALLGMLWIWDYWRLRANNAELDGLRIEAAEQREQIQLFQETLAETKHEMDRVLDLERKVRIIANLPGAAAAGGQDVTELAPASSPGDESETPLALPVGVPLDLGEDVEQMLPISQEDRVGGEGGLAGRSTPGARDLVALGERAEILESVATIRADSLDSLLNDLGDKRNRLMSMPSVWPTRGWLTSRYGYRISPFTGRRQHHGGIDIAAKAGTPVHAPARGRVTFTGKKGPLGNSIVIDHGFGVRTIYGHSQAIHVKTGENVERGQLLASVGSTGRSTGPHLHYAVEVRGKSRDPLDYILD